MPEWMPIVIRANACLFSVLARQKLIDWVKNEVIFFLQRLKHVFFFFTTTRLIKSSRIEHRCWWKYQHRSKVGVIAGVVIHVIQTAVMSIHLSVCPHESLIAAVSRKPSVLFQTCLLIFQSVACLHNAFLRCLPHNKEECQRWFWYVRGKWRTIKRQMELIWAWLKFDRPHELQRGNKKNKNPAFTTLRGLSLKNKPK